MTRGDDLTGIERQLLVLGRQLEAVRRASPDPTSTMDRAAYLLLTEIDDEPRSVGWLAERLHLDQSTVLRQTSSLEQHELVRKIDDPAGGRAALLEVTDEGRRRMGSVRSGRIDRVAATLADWPAADLHQLARLLERLNGSLDRRLRDRPTTA